SSVALAGGGRPICLLSQTVRRWRSTGLGCHGRTGTFPVSRRSRPEDGRLELLRRRLRLRERLLLLGRLGFLLRRRPPQAFPITSRVVRLEGHGRRGPP